MLCFRFLLVAMIFGFSSFAVDCFEIDGKIACESGITIGQVSYSGPNVSIIKFHNGCGYIIDGVNGKNGWIAQQGVGAPYCLSQQLWTLALMKSQPTQWSSNGSAPITMNYLGDVSAPVASFGFQQSISNEFRFDFLDTSTSDVSISSYSWSMDGASYSIPNPIHIFSTSGSFAVSLTVTDATGQSTTTTQTVFVTGAPIDAVFTYLGPLDTDSNTVPDTVQISYTDSTVYPVPSLATNRVLFVNGVALGSGLGSSGTYDVPYVSPSTDYLVSLVITYDGYDFPVTETVTFTDAGPPTGGGGGTGGTGGTVDLTGIEESIDSLDDTLTDLTDGILDDYTPSGNDPTWLDMPALVNARTGNLGTSLGLSDLYPAAALAPTIEFPFGDHVGNIYGHSTGAVNVSVDFSNPARFGGLINALVVGLRAICYAAFTILWVKLMIKSWNFF